MQLNRWLSEKSGAEKKELFNTFWSELKQTAYPVSKGELTVPISIESFQLEGEQRDVLMQDIKNCINALQGIKKALLKSKLLETFTSLNAEEIEMMYQLGDKEAAAILRADLFYNGEGFKMVELNSDFPDGFCMHDKTVNALGNIQNKTVQQDLHAQLLVDMIEQKGIAKEDCIVIAYNEGREFIDEFALAQLELEKRAYTNVHYTEVTNIELQDDGAFFEGQKIKLLRRGFEFSSVPEDLLQKFVELESKSLLEVINSFAERVIGHKSLLPLLHRHEFQEILPQAQKESITRIIPYTATGKDIPDDVAEKDRWVIKPSGLAEGRGVVIGSDVDQKQWEDACKQLKEAPDDFVIQERVVIPEEDFELENGIIKRKYDICPHFIVNGNQVHEGHILVRFSESNILNIFQGGGISYLL